MDSSQLIVDGRPDWGTINYQLPQTINYLRSPLLMPTLEIDFAHSPEDRRDPMSSEILEVVDVRLGSRSLNDQAVEDAALELLRQVETHKQQSPRAI